MVGCTKVARGLVVEGLGIQAAVMCGGAVIVVSVEAHVI